MAFITNDSTYHHLARRMQALLDLESIASGAVGGEEMITKGLDLLMRVLDAETGVLFLAAGDELVPQKVVTRSTRKVAPALGKAAVSGGSREAAAYRTGEPAAGNTVDAFPYGEVGFNVTSFAVIPLANRPRCLGVITVFNKLSGQFGPEDVKLGKTFARLFTTMLDKILAMEKAGRENNDKNVLIDIFREAFVREGLSGYINSLLPKLRSHLLCDIVGLTLDSERLPFSATWVSFSDTAACWDDVKRQKPTPGPFHCIDLRRRGIVISDTLEERMRSLGMQTGCFFPLFSEHGGVGALHLWRKDMGMYFDRPPESTVDMVRQCNLAIERLLHAEETRSSARRLEKELAGLSGRYDTLDRSTKTLSALLNIVLLGQGTASVTGYLATVLKNTIVIQDPFLAVIDFAAPGGQYAQGSPAISRFAWTHTDWELLTRVAAADGPVPVVGEPPGPAGKVIMPIRMNEELLGFLTLVATHGPIEAEETSIIKQAAVAYSFALLGRRTTMDMDRRREGEYLNRLLAGNLPREGWAQVDLALPRRAVIVHLDNNGGPAGRFFSWDDARRHLFAMAFDVVKRVSPESILGGNGNQIVLLAVDGRPEDKGKPPAVKGLVNTVAQSLEKALAETAVGFKVTSGIGRCATSVPDYAASYRDAQNCLSLCQTMGRDVLSFDDLGLLGILMDIPDKDELRRFSDNYLRDIIQHENRHGTPLLQTLELYFQNRFRRNQLSRAMHVHINTINYRLKKAEELLGIDMADPADLLELQMALTLHRLGNGR